MPLFNSFHYLPLETSNSIRIIVLDAAADGDAPLVCSLIQVLPGPQANYHAISYVWGEPGALAPQPLEVRHDEDISYLRITPSADAALRRFRLRAGPRYLWLDAICLNQKDDVEKGQQIPRMGDIYRQAKEVLIWLGVQNEAASLFRFFCKTSKISLTEGRQWDRAKKVASLMGRNLPRTGPGGLGCMMDFFSQSWFARRWIIQEAMLARQATVWCGTSSIPLSVLSAAAMRIQMLDISWYEVRMVVRLCAPTTRRVLLELLWDFHEATCQDPRDRIAAVLGLLPEDSPMTFDYSLEWSESYRRLATSMLEHGSDAIKLQVLLHLFEFGPVSLPNQDYPSWVPDWSQRRQRTLPFHSRIRNVDTYEAYPASPGNPSVSSLKLDNGELHVSWNIRFGGPWGLRPKYVANFPAPAENKKMGAQRIIQLLKNILPDNPQSGADILAIMSVIKAVVNFSENRNHLALQTKHLDEYLQTLRRALPASCNQQLPEIFRHLEYLLQDFCLCSLSPIGVDSGPRYYGLGPLQINSRDVLVPVWFPEFKSDRTWRSPSDEAPVTTMPAITMLVVRPVEELLEESRERAARIIGPAVCVLVEAQEGQGILDWFSQLKAFFGRQKNSIRLI